MIGRFTPAERDLIRLLRQPVPEHRCITISATARRWTVATLDKAKARGRGKSFGEAWQRWRTAGAKSIAIARDGDAAGRIGVGEAIADLFRAVVLLGSVRRLRRKLDRLAQRRGLDLGAGSVASLAAEWRKAHADLNANPDERPEVDDAAGDELNRIEAAMLATPILSAADATEAAALLADSLARRLSLNHDTERGLACSVRDWLATI